MVHVRKLGSQPTDVNSKEPTERPGTFPGASGTETEEWVWLPHVPSTSWFPEQQLHKRERSFSQRTLQSRGDCHSCEADIPVRGDFKAEGTATPVRKAMRREEHAHCDTGSRSLVFLVNLKVYFSMLEITDLHASKYIVLLLSFKTKTTLPNDVSIQHSGNMFKLLGQ